MRMRREKKILPPQKSGFVDLLILTVTELCAHIYEMIEKFLINLHSLKCINMNILFVVLASLSIDNLV